jgi:molybdate transport system regulatory protein
MPAPAPAPPGPRLSIRIDLAGGGRIGPGKVALLEAIGRTGSISAAGRALRMSYRRAWGLIEEMNRSLATDVVQTASGGSGGGGAALTAAGHAIIHRYRAIQAATEAAAQDELDLLSASLGGRSPGTNRAADA